MAITSWVKSLNRKTFKSWQIPAPIRQEFGIRDGDYVDATVRLGTEAHSGEFRISSEGELQLRASLARTVGNYARNHPTEYAKFELGSVLHSTSEDIARAEREEKSLTETERKAIVTERIGQGVFRSRLMTVYGGKCAVTGIDIGPLLRASHIKPWKDSKNTERLRSENGLLLIANLDAAFDTGYISFSDKGEMLFSKSLGPEPHTVLGIEKNSKLRVPPSARQKEYLAYHREKVARLG